MSESHRPRPHQVLRLVGHTPLVELRHLSPRPGLRLYAKLEGQNPSGSIKDRIVLAMLRGAFARGRLATGGTVVEASTGNTAIALAMACKQMGLEAHVVIPRGAVPAIADLLRLYGAAVTWCEPAGGMRGAIELAQRLAAERG